MKQTTIELNGRTYDVVTGQPIKKTDKQNTAVAKKPAVAKTGYIDGFKRPKGAAPLQPQRSTHKTPSKPLPEVHRVAKTTKAAQKIHQRQQRAKVLLRNAVKPPVRKEINQSTAPHVSPVPGISSKLLERAKSVKKSEHISRFGNAHASTKPVVRQAAVKPRAERKESLMAKGKPAVKRAIEEPSRTETPKKTKKNRLPHWVLASVAGLAIVGYVVYLNLPNLAMKVAAVRAGFSANLPNYNPEGFRLTGPIAYSQGQITIAYHSKSDARQYQINQKKSAWDSESLLTNFVTSKPDYQTYRDHGLTIYMYGASNATWVNSGVWYTIDGQSQLSAEQIIKIAASL